jgi:hypothetical protein
MNGRSPGASRRIAIEATAELAVGLEKQRDIIVDAVRAQAHRDEGFDSTAEQATTSPEMHGETRGQINWSKRQRILETAEKRERASTQTRIRKFDMRWKQRGESTNPSKPRYLPLRQYADRSVG